MKHLIPERWHRFLAVGWYVNLDFVIALFCYALMRPDGDLMPLIRDIAIVELILMLLAYGILVGDLILTINSWKERRNN